MTLSTALETATTGSRELDALIAMEWGMLPELAFQPCAGSMIDPACWGTGAYTSWTAPPWSTDLTACVALVQEKLLGCKIQLFIDTRITGAFVFSKWSGKWFTSISIDTRLALLRAANAALREVGNHA